MWPWKKNKWWRDGNRPFPWKDDNYLIAEKAYEAYTNEFYRASRFATTTNVEFKDLPVTAKEVWRKTADAIARWVIIADSGRGDFD